MLSRIAESLYWIGRYLERAEDTARLLESHVQTLLEDPITDEGTATSHLLAVMGIEAEDEMGFDSLVQMLGWDTSCRTSMVSAFWGARESARRSREVISADLWEAINTTWNMVRNNRLQRHRAPEACQLIRERCALITGLVDGTMAHDQGWQFLMLGKNLERVDMTSRIIESSMINPDEDAAWMNATRACGGYHSFRLTHRGVEDPQDAAEFLLLDRLFPRSVVFCLDRAERILMRLDSTSGLGQLSETIRVLGAARAELEYRPRHELLDSVSERMALLQTTIASTDLAVAERYFDVANSVTWQAGVR